MSYKFLEVIIPNKTFKLIYEIRKLTHNLLPNHHSEISFHIIFLIGSSYFEEKSLSLKSLLTDSPYSEMGIRTHLKFLINNDLVFISDSEKDGRIKYVNPTNKLVDIFYKLDLAVLDKLKDIDLHNQDIC
jgi:hypothetical protein